MESLIRNLKSANEGTISWFEFLLYIGKKINAFRKSAFFYCFLTVAITAILGFFVAEFWAVTIIMSVILPACSTKN